MKHTVMIGAACGLLLSSAAQAGSGGLPVMESVPRWDEGYGFELYHERYGSDTLLNGHNKIANPLGLESATEETWLKGTYYPVKEFGLVAKLPYIDHYKDVNQGGVKHRQSDSGFGDMELGAALKRYWNWQGATADISFVPQLRLPTGSTSGEMPVGDGSVDVGFTADAKWEDFTHMLMAGTSYWKNQKGSRGINMGDTLDTHVMYGYHVYAWPEEQAGFFLIPKVEAMWEGSGQDLDGKTGGLVVRAGPAIKLYRANYLMYLEAGFPVYERVNATHLAEGNLYRISIGAGF